MSTESKLPWYGTAASKDIPKQLDEQSFTMADLYELARKWPNRLERYENYAVLGVVGLSSSVSAVVLNEYVRRAFFMGSIMRGFSVFFNIVFPASISIATSSVLVVKPVMGESPVCPVCIGLRQASINIGAGVVYPLIYNQLIYLASIHYSHLYHLPSINTQPKEFWQFLKPKWSSLKWPTIWLTAAHLTLAPICVSLAEKSVLKMQSVLEENPELIAELEAAQQPGFWRRTQLYLKSVFA